MPNNCWNKVRLSANPSVIQELLESDFSFAAIRPIPETLDEKNWNDWCSKNWGTKWDRYDYKLEDSGKEALLMYFNTAWSPACVLYQYLLRKYPDMWLRCDWDEEGGEAGIFVGYTDKQGNVQIHSLAWDDWCLEEYAHKFRKDRPTNIRNHSEASE